MLRFSIPAINPRGNRLKMLNSKNLIMKINKHSKRLKYLVELIDMERIGNADQLSKRVGISRTKLFDLFDEFKSEGVDIRFNRRKSSFCFCNEYRVKVVQPITIVNNEGVVVSSESYD